MPDSDDNDEMDGFVADRLVGRSAHLDRLLAAVEESRDRPVTISISGEAGIGKSALIDAFAEQLTVDGHQVLRGACSVVLREPIPFAPISTALRNAGISTSDLPAGGRTELFDAILRALDDLRPPGAVQVLAVDDLHWADVGTVEVLGHLARNLPPGHLIVLCYRSDQAPVDPEAGMVLDTVVASRQVRRVDLQRLSDGELDQLFAQQTGRAPTAGEHRRLMERSDGNPFIAGELVRTGQLDRLPGRLQDLLTARTAGLSKDAKDLVAAMAVLGRPAGQRLIDAIVQLPGRRSLAAAAQAVASGVLVIDHEAGGYAFRHALAQEAVLAQMLPGVRVDLHRRIAEALGAIPATRRRAGAAAEWAAHRRAVGDEPEAFEATAVAAATAARVFARREAWRQHQHLVALLDNGAAPDDVDVGGLLADASEAARWAGAPHEAVGLARRALATTQNPAARARITERLGRCLWDCGDTAAADAAYTEADRLAAALPEGPLHATIAASRSRLALQAGRYPEAAELAVAATALARRVEAPAEEARATMVQGMCRTVAGDLETGIALIRRSARLADRWGEVEDQRRIASNLAFALLMAGHAAEACRVAVDALAVARRQSAIIGTGAALVSNTVVLLWITGRWDAAEQLSEEAFAEGVTAGQALLVRLARAELDMSRGHLDSARENLDAAAYLGDQQTSVSIVADLAIGQAEWSLLDGDLDAAVAHIDRAIDVLRAGTETRELARACAIGLRIAADRAAVLTARRDPALPTDRAGLLRDTVATIEAAGPSPEVMAFCATAVGEWARYSGSADAAEQWAAVADAWAALPCPLQEAYARFRRAEALVPGDRSAAAEQLRRAHLIAQQLSAGPLLADIATLGRRSRIHLQRAGRPERPAAGPFGLTRREAEVLDELAEGLTNKQIAARLYLSPRTVDVHVGNVLMKLGARTRAEAVATAARAAAGTAGAGTAAAGTTGAGTTGAGTTGAGTAGAGTAGAGFAAVATGVAAPGRRLPRQASGR